MKCVKKKWNRILSIVLSIVIIITCIPAQSILAADEIVFDKSEIEITMNGNATAQETISIASWSIPEEATAEQIEITWQSEQVEVATVSVDENNSKSAKITGLKAGKANITCTVTYDDGQEGSEVATYTQTAQVTVKQKPVLTITANPNTSISYPNKVTFDVTSVPDISITGQTILFSVIDENGEIVADIQQGTGITLSVGVYTVKASVAAAIGVNGEEYLASAADDLTYTVEKGTIQGNVSGVTRKELYKGQKFDITLPTPEVTLADGSKKEISGSYKVSLTNLTEASNGAETLEDCIPGTTITLKAVNVGDATIETEFVPAEVENYNNYKTTHHITVKKIPVIVSWGTSVQHEKIYDGTTSYTLTTEPTVTWATENYDGREELTLPTVSAIEGSYVFSLEEKNAGRRSAILSKDKLTLSNVADFEIAEDVTVIVNVKPIELNVDNIETTGMVADGKGYDASSIAVMQSSTPSLKIGDNILEEDRDLLSLYYEAHYYDDKNQKVYGNPDEDVTASKVVFSNIQVLKNGQTTENYVFTEDISIPELTGQFIIRANEEFVTFTELELGTTVAENYDGNIVDIYWLNEEENGILEKEGFEFAVNSGNEETPVWNWSAGYSVENGNAPKKVYAKGTSGDKAGKISKGAYIARDTVVPVGQIFAQIGNETAVSITELSEEFRTIAKGEGVQITFTGSDAGSKISRIECIGTDTAWTQNDADAWSGKTPDYTFEINTELDKSVEVTQEIQTVGKETELKRFYYARITDYAGNVGYVSSTGVLLDVTVPEANVELAATDHIFENKNVYAGDVTFTVALEDNNISSGIVEVEAILKKNGSLIGTYRTQDSSVWSSSETLTAIQTLHDLNAPTEEQILATRGSSISGIFTDLEEANGYTLQIVAKDKAGHISAVAETCFIVDKTAPVIEIGDKSGLENKNEGDYDRYFTGGSIRVIVRDTTLSTAVAELLEGIEDEEDAWNKTVDSATGMITQEIVLEFGENASKYQKEGSYGFTVSAQDACERANIETCEEFTLDYTGPLYTVEYSDVDPASWREEGGTTLYYNKDIRADFNIEEASTYEDADIVIKVKNKADEEVMKWENGVASVKDSNYVVTHAEDTKKFSFEVKAAVATEDEGYTFEIAGTDIAGNPLKAKEVAEEEEMHIVRALDMTAPKLTEVTYSTEEEEDAKLLFNSVTKEDNDGVQKVRDYINAETTMTFTITEKHPAENVYSLSSENGEKTIIWTSGISTDEYTSQIEVPMYGDKGDEQIVQYTILDKAGNKAEAGTALELRSKTNTSFEEGVFKDQYTVDTVVPKITYEYEEFNPDRQDDGIDYFKLKQELKIKVTVEEHNFCTPEAQVALYSIENSTEAQKKDSSPQVSESEWEADGDRHVKIFTLNGNDQYRITISGNDCAKNDLELKKKKDEKISVRQNETTKETELKFAIDSKLPMINDNQKPAVTISGTSSTVESGDSAGQTLYGGDVTFKVTVYDPVGPKYASGIYSLKLNVEAEDGTKAEATVNKDGVISSEGGISVARVKGDPKELGRGKENICEYNVTIQSSTFNSNNIVLSVVAEDIATNKKEVESEPVSIDTTPPQATISYDNNEVSNGRYFHETRTAIVQVQERNFGNECMSFNVNGGSVQLNFTQTSAGSGNGDNAIWEATYTFERDDEYVITAECEDSIHNVGTVQFEGEAPEEFVVDKTLPIIEVEFDNNNAFNENYYDAQRTATIIITEHNFEPNEVEIIGEGNDAGVGITYPVLGSWSSSGDEHRASIVYSQDGLYTLDVEYTDLATNEAEDIEEEEFTIDTTDPEVTITGVEEQMPYSGEVRPEISFSDNNYDSHAITMTRTERENIGVDVTEAIVGAMGVSIDGNGKGTGNRILEDVEHLEENDGIYTLTVEVIDKAGRSTEESVTYSVNRFGSVYVYSQDLADILNGYYQKIQGDLYITAYNANHLVENSTKLEITCDGSVIANQRSNAELESARQNSEGGWFAYKFDLKHEDFSKDGNYEITLSDKDEAGNTRTNSDTPVNFYIDSTAPMIDSIIGLEESIVNANEHQIGYAISDAIALDQIAIYVNDEQVEKITEFDNKTAYENSFVIGTGMRQKVRIVAYDKAGNIIDTEADTFAPAYMFRPEITVSTNFLVRWYANTMAFIASIGVAVLAVGGIIIMGVVKTRKKQNVAEED